MDTIIVDQISYHLPVGITDVQQLITTARRRKTQIRIRGSSHSVSESIYPDISSYGYQDSIFVMLSKMNTVTIDKNANIVIVEAGCHLGFDPFDPTNISTLKNSLFYQLNEAGYALPDTGGITHQTVGGFLSTGSSGGSTRYSFFDALQSITFFPADKDNPQPKTVGINDDPDLFYAAGVSMGLLGIIVSATFSLEKKFNIKGRETITSIKDCAIDMSGKGAPGNTNKISLREFITDREYYRILWYPQPQIARATVWEASRIPSEPDFQPIPYHEFAPVLGSYIIPQLAAEAVYTVIGQWPRWLGNTIGTNSDLYEKLTGFVSQNFYSKIFPNVLPFFVTEDKDNKEHPHKPQEFQDYWYTGLPMDDGVNDAFFSVEFTELWIPFDKNGTTDTISKVLVALNQLFIQMYDNGKGPIPGGAFATELYAAKSNNFWMSPSFKTDALRVDVFWFDKNYGSPVESFYPLFWNALEEFDFRCHWGKHLPPPTSGQGVEYLRRQYPKWDDFMQLRAKLDPLNVFLNEYWKKHLGIIPWQK